MAATSATDAWAVGTTSALGGPLKTLVQHWDGTDWNVIPSPGAGTSATLQAVDVVAPDDVWAVGYYFEAGNFVPLIEHWDGNSWTVVPSPHLRGQYLLDVDAVAADDIWAVGTVTEHWDGKEWRVVDAPRDAESVSAAAPGDVWATGNRVSHWNGSAWSEGAQPPMPPETYSSIVGGVDAASADDVWAVGFFAREQNADAGPYRAYTARWNGSTWSRVPAPSPDDSYFNGVDRVSSGDAWAVGAVGFAPPKQMVQHWDGKRWLILSSPPASELLKVSALPDGVAFSVGYVQTPVGYDTVAQRVCEVRIGESGFSPGSVKVGTGKDMTWTVPAATPRGHRLGDDSGLGLFASGTIAPGNSYSFRFFASGTYTVTDRTNRKTGTVGVPMGADATAGPPTRTFRLSWASGGLPSGYVSDIEIKRPGDAFSPWRSGQSAGGGTFTPDAGAGLYEFRARLRSLTNGATSGWSPVKPIDVS